MGELREWEARNWKEKIVIRRLLTSAQDGPYRNAAQFIKKSLNEIEDDNYCLGEWYVKIAIEYGMPGSISDLKRETIS